MKRHFTGSTDPGLVRSVNQDAYYMDPEGRFFIVADGMGGHAGGQEASSIATTEVKEYLNAHWDDDLPSEELLTKALELANERILDDQYRHPERGDMGTTAVMVIFRHDGVWSANIGDSRLYRMRGSQLEQLTDDHTWVARAMKVGDISKEQARSHPWRHVLSQCLGRKDLYKIDVQQLDVVSGDRLLLCSDGLTEEVPDELISHCLEGYDGKEAVAELIEKAKNAGGSDNITIILLKEV
jgi:protein phosphatase